MRTAAIISAAVQRELDRRGWTRADLARVLGVDPPWVSNKLSGYRAWRMADLDLLTERLDVPLAQLLTEPRLALVGAGDTREYPRANVSNVPTSNRSRDYFTTTYCLAA